MASRMRKSVTSLAAVMRATLSSPPKLHNTIMPLAQSIAPVQSSTVSRRMLCTDNPNWKFPKPELFKVEMGNGEKEIDDEKKSNNEKGPEDDKILKMTDCFNKFQKLLVACETDFTFALDLATKLGDARNILVITRNCRHEMKRLYPYTESQMVRLSELGATVLCSVDVDHYCRFHGKLYDHVIMDKSGYVRKN